MLRNVQFFLLLIIIAVLEVILPTCSYHNRIYLNISQLCVVVIVLVLKVWILLLR